jgi:uncharacterized protein with NRDE domain
MCTLALYFQSFEEYPLLVVANRDEHFDRPSAAPSLHNHNPKIVAGKDLRAGGTWFGVNEHGLMAGILNRRVDGAALPAGAARSRGLLCMALLQWESARAANRFLSAHEDRYNPFTVVFADRDAAFVAYNEDPKIIIRPLDPGLHVFSSAATLDLTSAKADRAYQRFALLLTDPVVTADQPRYWLPGLQSILADHSLRDGSDDPGDAICVHRENSGTVSSSVAFLSKARARFETFYCPGAPCRHAFTDSLSLPVR